MNNVEKEPPHGGLDPAIDFQDESRPETNLLSHKILTGEDYHHIDKEEEAEPYAFFSLFILSLMGFILIVCRTYGLHISSYIMYPWYSVIGLATLHIYLPKIITYYVVLIGLILFDIIILIMPFIFTNNTHFLHMPNIYFLLIYAIIAIILSWFFFPEITTE